MRGNKTIDSVIINAQVGYLVVEMKLKKGVKRTLKWWLENDLSSRCFLVTRYSSKQRKVLINKLDNFIKCQSSKQ